jgi:hypothetical protein
VPSPAHCYTAPPHAQKGAYLGQFLSVLGQFLSVLERKKYGYVKNVLISDKLIGALPLGQFLLFGGGRGWKRGWFWWSVQKKGFNAPQGLRVSKKKVNSLQADSVL